MLKEEITQPTKEKKNGFFQEKDSWIFRLVVFLIGCLGIIIISLLVGIIVYAAVLNGKPETEALKNTYDMFTNVFTYLVLFVILLIVSRPRLRDIVKGIKDYQKIILGICIGHLLISATAAYGTIIDLFITLETNGNEESIETMLIQYPFSIIVIAFIGPICEELAYRYGLFSCINKKSKVLAYIITIFIFAFIHFDFSNPRLDVEFLNLPSYLIAAGILCYAYDKYGFEVAMVAHIVNNLTACLLILGS